MYHGLLTATLADFGICGPPLRWLASYLGGPMLIVRFDGGLCVSF